MAKTMTTKQKQRIQKLMPNGIPKYVRIYDNGGKTADRYTVVFTGNYNNIKSRGSSYYRYHNILAMSENPYYPLGVCISDSYPQIIDRPSYSHLGKKISFTDLPESCKKATIQNYIDIWELSE